MKKYQNALDKLSKKAIFIAEREVTRKAAFATRDASKRLVKKVFTIRSPYVVNSIRVKKLPAETWVGSLNEGLALQETGGATKGKNGRNKRITTSTAANQGLTAYPRTTTARGKNRMGKIDIEKSTPQAHVGFGNSRRTVSPKNSKHENWLRIRRAIATTVRRLAQM